MSLSLPPEVNKRGACDFPKSTLAKHLNAALNDFF
jgi:hypothetical protein